MSNETNTAAKWVKVNSVQYTNGRWTITRNTLRQGEWVLSDNTRPDWVMSCATLKNAKGNAERMERSAGRPWLVLA